MKEEGSEHISVWNGFSSSRTYWDRNGKVKSQGCTSHNYSTHVSYERGLSYDHTFLAKMGYKVTECGGGRAEGFTDIEIGLRGRLNPYRNGRSWEARLIIPTGYDRRSSRRIGYGRFGLDLAVARGDTYGSHDYIEYQAGFRFYEGPPAHQFRAHVQRGWPLRKGETARANVRLQGILSFGNGEEEGISFVDHSRLPEFDVVKISGEIKSEVDDDWTIAAGMSMNLLGRNTGRSGGFHLTFSRNL